MVLFWKSAAGILVAAVLVLAVGSQQKDMALLLTLAASIMTAMSAFTYLEPVLDFLCQLEALGDLQSGVLGILLKIVGISLVTEMAGGICRDSGNSALAQGMQLLGSSVILSQSLPILETLLDLIEGILGEL